MKPVVFATLIAALPLMAACDAVPRADNTYAADGGVYSCVSAVDFNRCRIQNDKNGAFVTKRRNTN